MPKKFICTLTKSELEELYLGQHLTLDEICKHIGCKSRLTAQHILNKHGISTNANERTSFAKRGGRTDEEFKEFLIKEYIQNKRSMTSIAHELHISWVIVSKYLDKYKISKRTKSEQQRKEGSVNWHGGKNIRSNGYIEIYCPDHPNANVRKYVYEHQLVAESKLKRYLKKGEVVHHIDFNKSNNSPDNLIVLTNDNHLKLHGLLRKGLSFQEAIKKVEVINE